MARPMVNQRSETTYASFDDAGARATADDQCATSCEGSAAGANDISTEHDEEYEESSSTNQGRGGLAAHDERNGRRTGGPGLPMWALWSASA